MPKTSYYRGGSVDLFARVIELLERGETICLVTIVVSDNADIPTGRKTIVLADGTMEWGTGLAHLDSTLRVLALKALSDRKKRTLEIEDRVRVFFDVLSAEAELLVCVAGHIYSSLILPARSDFA